MQTAQNSNTKSLVPIYVATMLLSASLLFLVQPMFARMALPLLGGTPAVWAIAMVFFQGVLLGGYCYAHILKKYLAPSHAVIVHLILLGLWPNQSATHSFFCPPLRPCCKAGLPEPPTKMLPTLIFYTAPVTLAV
jgi:hypothetical protein